MPKVINRGCEHCGGDLFDDEDGLRCFQCHRVSRFTREAFQAVPEGMCKVKVRVPVIPKPPAKRNGVGRPSRYNKDVVAILFDYRNMSAADLERKWGMQRAYFYYLKKRWKARGIIIPVGYKEKARDNHQDTS